jgi:hypothetical protein
VSSEHQGAIERTGLAWERSAIASLAVVALIVRQGIVAGPLALAIPIAALLAAAAGLQWHLSRRVGPGRPEQGTAVAQGLVGLLAAVTLVVAAGAAALTIAS